MLVLVLFLILYSKEIPLLCPILWFFNPLCDFFAPLCNFWAAPLCNRKKLPHFVIFFAPLCNFVCLCNTWRVSFGSNSLKTKLQKLMIRKRPHPFMTSPLFSPFWYWKNDTFISFDCVAHFRPNLVRMILRPKGKLYWLNID